MSSDSAFLAIVAGYVAVVLWCLAFGDSLRALADTVARPGRLGRRVFLSVALAGAMFAVLAVIAVVATREGGPARNAGLGTTLEPQPRVHAWLGFPRAVTLHDGRAQARSTARSPKPASRAQRTSGVQMTRVSYATKTVSAPTTPAEGTSPTRSSAGTGPEPLPAPPQASAPTHLKAP